MRLKCRINNVFTGCPGNFSDWVEGREFQGVKVTESDQVRGWDDIVTGEEKVDMCFRVELHVASVTSAMVYLTYVPMSLEDLKKKCETWEVDCNSERIPVVVMPLGKSPDHKKGGGCTELRVRETSDMKHGFGILPLIEQVDFKF